MMKKFMQKTVSCVLIMLFVLQLSPCVFAHTYSQEGILAKGYIGADYNGYYIGGEDVGWSIDEGCHTNGTTLTYSFATDDEYLTTLYKLNTANGARTWSDVVTITEKTDGSGTGLIKTVKNENSATIAVFTNAQVNSSGHLTSWQILINRAHVQTAYIMAHELGHAIGLNDLYTEQNYGKLMCGIGTNMSRTPTDLDKWGAKVITGVHSSHSWGYKYHSVVSGNNRHIKYCTDCNGLTNTISSCTYNSQNICTYCGVPYGTQPW